VRELHGPAQSARAGALLATQGRRSPPKGHNADVDAALMMCARPSASSPSRKVRRLRAIDSTLVSNAFAHADSGRSSGTLIAMTPDGCVSGW
jgi:hypothetical protein